MQTTRFIFTLILLQSGCQGLLPGRAKPSDSDSRTNDSVHPDNPSVESENSVNRKSQSKASSDAQNSSTSTPVTSPLNRNCTGAILPFKYNTPYLTKTFKSLDTSFSNLMLKSTCGVDDFGEFRFTDANKNRIYTCLESSSLWCELKNSDANTSDQPGNPYTHLGAYLFRPSKETGSPIRDLLVLEIRLMNDLFSLNLFFQNAAGGGGYSGIHFQGESDWREVKCLANGCIASGAIQVRADKRIPRARILMTDNSSVEVPLVVVPK